MKLLLKLLLIITSVLLISCDTENKSVEECLEMLASYVDDAFAYVPSGRKHVA